MKGRPRHCKCGIDSIQLLPRLPNWIVLSIRNIIIITTRPKPAYGRQDLAGSWGQNTDQAGTFWGVLNVSLCASSAHLGYKPTWTMKNHKNQPGIMKNQLGTIKTMKTQPEPWKTNLEPWKTMKTDLEPWKPTKNHEKPTRNHEKSWKPTMNHEKPT